MALGQRLEIRQGQSLVMTPQLQQAIKLLQLSNIELAEYCEAELEKNPLLERDEIRAARRRARDGRSATSLPNAPTKSLAREDFSKVADLDQSAHDNMYDGELTALRAGRGRRPAADRLDHGQIRAAALTATRIRWNPRSPAAARSRIIWKNRWRSRRCCPTTA